MSTPSRAKKTARKNPVAHTPTKGGRGRLTAAENARQGARKKRSPEKKSELGG
jgi:hypothetical protein